MRLAANQASKRFYDLVWPLRSDVLRVAQFLCRDPMLAEDLAQETLLKAFRALDRDRVAGRDLKGWLLAILRNNWKDRLRAFRAETSLEGLIDEPEGVERTEPDAADYRDDPQSLLNAFSDQQIIDQLQALPEEIRWTLLLVDVEGLGVSEAAEILDVPAGTIKSRAFRGRQMLREALLPVARERRWMKDERSSSIEAKPPLGGPV